MKLGFWGRVKNVMQSLIWMENSLGGGMIESVLNLLSLGVGGGQQRGEDRLLPRVSTMAVWSTGA